MRCSPEFRARVGKQADLARRGTGRGYTGQLTFTYGEVLWILTDLQKLHELEKANVGNSSATNASELPSGQSPPST